MIDWRDIQRFLYSHYLLTGVRQAVGALTPAVVIVASGHSYAVGLAMSIGAFCVAIVDQAAGSQSQAQKGMLLAMGLSVVSAVLTGLVSAHSLLIWLVVPILTFLFSMLAVYGVRGGLLGFVGLLMMTLTMRSPMGVSEVWAYSAYLFGGGFFYFVYSLTVRRFFRAREERETLAAAFFSMADYLRSRAALYDNRQELDVVYRDLIRSQSAVVDAVQTLGNDRPPLLTKALQRLLTNFVDTRTDFSSIRNGLHEPTVLRAMHDTLISMADQMARLALNVARNRSNPVEPPAQASLEIIRSVLQESANEQYGPEKRGALQVLQQVYERFCRAQGMLNELAQHTSNSHSRTNVTVPDQTGSDFSRPFILERWRPGLYFGSLRLSAPGFRHALRVTVAVLLAMSLSYAMAQTFQDDALKAIGTHGYWVVLTVIVVMKPGFALTHQRNGWRLGGTLIGCGVALMLFHLIHDAALYLAVLFLFGVLGYAFIQVNYLVSALCNTVLVLTAFHLLSPGGDVVVGARFVDTLLGCTVALLCSYILPTWEVRFLPGLANELKVANIRLLKAAIAVIEAQHDAVDQARKNWSMAERAVYTALSRFSASFYRMMNEPMRHQQQAVIFNHVMIQSHVLAMQVMHIVATAESKPVATKEIKRALLDAKKLLESQDVAVDTINERYSMNEPHSVSDRVVPSMALQQLADAAEAISQDMARVQSPQANAPPGGS